MTNDWQVLANSSRSATPSLMNNKRLATSYVLRSVNEKEGISKRWSIWNLRHRSASFWFHSLLKFLCSNVMGQKYLRCLKKHARTYRLVELLLLLGVAFWRVEISDEKWSIQKLSVRKKSASTFSIHPIIQKLDIAGRLPTGSHQSERSELNVVLVDCVSVRRRKIEFVIALHGVRWFDIQRRSPLRFEWSSWRLLWIYNWQLTVRA